MRIPLLLYIAKNHWQKTLSNAHETTPTARVFKIQKNQGW